MARKTSTTPAPSPFDLPTKRAISSLKGHLAHYKGEVIKAKRGHGTLVKLDQAQAATKTLTAALALLGVPVNNTAVRARVTKNRPWPLNRGDAIRGTLRALKQSGGALSAAELAQELRMARKLDLDESWDADLEALVRSACNSLERTATIIRADSPPGAEPQWRLA